MTDDNAATAAHPPCESLAALRDAHLGLRRALSDAAGESGATGRVERIRTFLAGACKAGAFISDTKERRVAQGILDFWSAELATSPEAQTSDFTSALLAPYDAAQTGSESDRAEQSKDDQRTLIRLAALARQWQDSGKQPGYLLTGETIEEAAKFADRNPDLDELVRESQRADRARRRRQRNWTYAGGFAALILALIGGVLTWQFKVLPKTGERLIQEVRESTSPEVQQNKLWWLQIAQPWLPPYDFSGTPKIAYVTLPKFRLWAPNFSGVHFRHVKFPNARLPAASFSGSTLYVKERDKVAQDDNDRNDFSGADLTFSQYLESRIYATSFADADLYRARFDRASLCDVDFSHADLRHASFFAASPDDKTYASLRKTVWWVADGWNSKHLEKLLDSPGPGQPNPASPSGTYQSASAADIQAARQALRRSVRFCKDVAEPLAESAPGTVDRAEALNHMAWTLATWGIDRDSPPAEDSCHVKGMPKDALAAADEAIGIIQDLKDKAAAEKTATDKDYPRLLATYRDTKAYILMQADQMVEAKALYEMNPERTAEDPSSLFRYAIALFGAGQKNEAEKAFKEVLEKPYLPKDGELQNLKQYIPPFVRQMAYKIIDEIYPTPKGLEPCPLPPAPTEEAK